MNTEKTDKPHRQPSLLQNWTSLIGLVVVVGSFFSFFLLVMLNAVARFSNPYISILTWMVAPAFLTIGAALTLVGVLRERRRRKGGTALVGTLQIDLSRPRDRRILVTF